MARELRRNRFFHDGEGDLDSDEFIGIRMRDNKKPPLYGRFFYFRLSATTVIITSVIVPFITVGTGAVVRIDVSSVRTVVSVYANVGRR